MQAKAQNHAYLPFQPHQISPQSKRITETRAEQKVVREILVFLHSCGVGTARAMRFFKAHGVDAVQVKTKKPLGSPRRIAVSRSRPMNRTV